MNKYSGKRILFVVPSQSSNGGEALGLGDIIRLLTLAPNFDAVAIGWCSRPGLFPLARLCGFIGDIFNEDTLSDMLSGYDAILNLGGTPVAPGCEEIEEIVVGDLLKGDGTLKSRTFDLPAAVADAIGIDAAVSWPVAEITQDRQDFEVGFNMRVPEAWAIKELPQQHWNDIEQALGESVSVSRQPPDGDLEAYISWIASCRILVSVVGLGCHLAMFLGKPLVVLSGPTDFGEAGDYPSGRVLYPPTPCAHRPCQLPSGVNDCGCMGDFDPGTIATVISDLLTGGKQQAENRA